MAGARVLGRKCPRDGALGCMRHGGEGSGGGGPMQPGPEYPCTAGLKLPTFRYGLVATYEMFFFRMAGGAEGGSFRARKYPPRVARGWGLALLSFSPHQYRTLISAVRPKIPPAPWPA